MTQRERVLIIAEAKRPITDATCMELAGITRARYFQLLRRFAARELRNSLVRNAYAGLINDLGFAASTAENVRDPNGAPRDSSSAALVAYVKLCRRLIPLYEASVRELRRRDRTEQKRRRRELKRAVGEARRRANEK
jgi:hypothetical protein